MDQLLSPIYVSASTGLPRDLPDDVFSVLSPGVILYVPDDKYLKIAVDPEELITNVSLIVSPNVAVVSVTFIKDNAEQVGLL